jgi:hypothetical protein
LSAEGRRLPERLVGPEVLRFVAALRPVVGEAAAGRDDDAILGGPFLGVGGSDLLLFRGLGPRGAGGDPLLYPTDLFGREPVVLLRRHRLPVIVRPRDREVERALLRPAGDEGRLAAVTADECLGERAQIEAALDLGLILAVAGKALLLQHRQYATDEEAFGVGSRGDEREREKQRRADGRAGQNHERIETVFPPCATEA